MPLIICIYYEKNNYADINRKEFGRATINVSLQTYNSGQMLKNRA